MTGNLFLRPAQYFRNDSHRKQGSTSEAARETSWRLDSPHTIIQFPAAAVNTFFPSCAMGTSPIMILRSRKKTQAIQAGVKNTSSRCFKTFFFFDSSFVPSFVALFIVRCIEILRCKKSHSRFFYDFCFCLVRSEVFSSCFSVKYCLMFMRKLCERSDFRWGTE